MKRAFKLTSTVCVTLAFLWNGRSTATTIVPLDQATNVPFKGSTSHLIEGGAGVFKAAVRASFDNGPFTAWMTSDAVAKPTNSAPKDATAIVMGPDVAEGRSVVTWNGFFSSNVVYDFEGVLRVSAVAATPTAALPVRTTRAQGKYLDPVPQQIGAAGSSIPLSYSLTTGAQVPAPGGPDSSELIVLGRFGLGTFADSEDFFPLDDSVPANTFNVFSIRIFETAGGANAVVQLFPSPDSRFNVTFDRTAAEIMSAITGAGWTRSPEGSLQLPADLPLVSATITNNSSSLTGSAAAVGTSIQAEAFDMRRGASDIPEPSSLTLLLIGTVAIGVSRRLLSRK